MSAVRGAVIISAIERYISQIIAIATMAIMSRILTPAETGLYLVASTVIVLADNFRSFGVGNYIVQEHTLRREAVRSAFTVALLMSLVIGFAINLVADQIAGFYEQPELRNLLSVATLAFVAIPFGSPIVAILQRELAFRELAYLNVAAALINAFVTIALGVAGIGPASYVWGFVVSSGCFAVLAFCVRPEGWIYRPCLADVRRVMSFGAVSSSVTVVNMACDLLPRLAFGKLLGFDAVGLYGRAVNVCQLPDRAIVSALQPVVLPAMAARVRAGGDLKASYMRGHALMSAIQWPTLIMLALLADPIVRVLLGSQWGEAPPLVRLIALASMALAPAFMTFPVLVAVGRVRDTLWSSLISLPPSAAITIFAASFGLTAAAASLFVTAPLQMLVSLYFVRRAIGLTSREMVDASRASVVLAMGTALVPALVVLLSPNGFALGWAETGLAAIGGASGWLAALWIIDHPIKTEISAVWGMLINATARRRIVRLPGRARQADR